MTIPADYLSTDTSHRDSRAVTTTNVHCLLGHSHVSLAITCLGTLLRYSAEPLELVLHDDGSITDEDAGRLDAALQSPTLIRRRDADERLADELRKYPLTLRWRQTNNLALKVTDCLAYETQDIFCQIDSDILMLRPFTGLFQLPPGVDARFLKDVEHAYSVRSWNLLMSPGLRLGQYVNSGCICMRRSTYDPDRIEWFLSRPSHRTKAYFVEQTTWAMRAMQMRSHLVDPRQLCIMRPNLQIDPQLIGIHFVAMHRPLLDEFLRNLNEHPLPASNPQAIRTVPVKRCTALNLAAVETKRILERTAKKFAH